jgi:cephalosporin-C deacetylase-like acetyl esterase
VGGLYSVELTLINKLEEGERVKKAAVAEGSKTIDARRGMLRELMLRQIGGLPAADCHLNAKVTGTIQADGYRMEKIIIFTPRKNVYVKDNLYVPGRLNGKTGAVLFLCGHSKLVKAHPAYQRVCCMLALAGFVVFIIDPVGQGERFSYLDSNGNLIVEWGCPEHDYARAQAFISGFESSRYFIHDVIRAVDYLISRPEVDEKRIGITGSSGGGTQCSLMMMMDNRIAAAPGVLSALLNG